MPMKKIATCVIASNSLQVSADSHSPPANSAKNSSPQNRHTPQPFPTTAKPTLKREFEEPVPEFRTTDVNYSSRDENGGNARVDRFREARELPTWGHSREDTFDKNQRTHPRVKIERIVDDDRDFLPFSNGDPSQGCKFTCTFPFAFTHKWGEKSSLKFHPVVKLGEIVFWKK
jgi:hypothetical protein